jgi:hypothetical protein
VKTLGIKILTNLVKVVDRKLTKWPVRHRKLARQRVTEFSLWSGWGQETAFCEHGDKPLRFMKCEPLC